MPEPTTEPIAPCASCPWRVGATSDRIPKFNEDRATCSLPQVASDGTDAFRPLMACHLSTEAANRPCVGYVVSEDGDANLAVRVAGITGSIDIAAMRDGTADLDLHPTFADMIAALVPDRAVTVGNATGNDYRIAK